MASLALALSACSSDNTPKNSTAQANPTGITINNTSEPETLDPQLAKGVQEGNIIRQFAEGLVSTDNDGKLIPAIAAEWSSPDNKVWTFKLRDANWSNGDAVTADDFVYSFRRLVDPATGSDYARSYLDDAKVLNDQAIINGNASPDTLGIKAIDAKTLEITLSEPVPYFVNMMTHWSVLPVHRASVEKFGEKWTDPANIVVNGAYKPSQWVVNKKIVLTKNPSYYDANAV